MGRKIVKPETDRRAAYLREKNRQQYYENNGKLKAKIRYLMKVNNIPKEDVKDIDDLNECLEYCQLIHIKNKYKF